MSARLKTWKPFLRLMAAQLIALALALAATRAGAWQWLACLGALAGASAILGRRLLFPLVALIRRAIGENVDDVPALPREWSELELALDRIERDLRQKTRALTQERSEASTLMSAISDAILAVNREGHPLFFNTRFAMLFGGRQLALENLRIEEILRNPAVTELYRRAIETGADQRQDLALYVQGDAAPRVFSLSASPLRADGGGTYGAVGIFHDITELKRSEKIRIDFVANASHELRTPVTAIKGFADTLKEDIAQGRSDGLTQYADAISRNANRLMDLVKDLLDLSSIESETESEMPKSDVETRELTDRVLSQLERRRAEKGHRIDTRIEAEHVHGHPQRIEQILLNLVDNAIKYVPPGGEIRVEWKAEGADVALRVTDNGPGIPHELQPRLFERFFRVDRARSRDVEGTGLGLAIVKHIVLRHGGTIAVQSEPGRGTVFVCRFPLAPVLQRN